MGNMLAQAIAGHRQKNPWGIQMDGGRPQLQFVFEYSDISKITGLALGTIYKHAHRRLFDPENLESVVLYCARYARWDVRERMFKLAMMHELPERPGLRPSERRKLKDQQDGEK